MEERHDQTPYGVGTLECQITQLLEQLQRPVRCPTFSHRLNGIRPMLVRLWHTGGGISERRARSRPERHSRMGAWAFQGDRPPRLWAISTEAGWTLADLLQELGRLELKALGHLKHGEMLGHGSQLPQRHTCSIGSGAGETIMGGTTMRMPGRDDRRSPCHYEAARIELRCRATVAHERQLILEHVTIYADGWARWVEEGHVYVGYIQAGRCCDPPEVSTL